MEKQGTIGIDVGGTKTMFGLFDHQFELIQEIKAKTPADKDEAEFTELLTSSVGQLLKVARKKRLSMAAIGVGCAGSPDPEKGLMRESPNIPFLRNFRFRPVLSKMTGANVYLANDLHAGIYGEQQFGAAVGKRHVIGVFIGTGIGGALIINGRLHLGATGQAGNIGHYLIHPAGLHAGSERDGFLDALSSRTAIAGEAAALALKQWAPHLLKSAGTDVKKIKAGDLAEAIEKGDSKVEDLVRSRSRLVGIALSNLVDFINPEMIVLGGGLVDAMPEIVRQEIRAGIDENATAAAREGLQVVVSKLKGHAITTGAAKLAFDFLT